MATITDIYNALVQQCVQAVYPYGTSEGSILGDDVDITVRSGWPDPNRLDALLAAGNSNINVYQPPGMQRNESRYSQYWLPLSENIPTLTLTADLDAKTVTVGGSVTNGENALVRVNGSGYVYTASSADTIDDVASELAQLIPNATSAGAVVSIPDAYSLLVRVGTSGKIIQELKRQQSIFQIMIYVPNPDDRDVLTKVIENRLAGIFYLSLIDDLAARMIWKSTEYYDSFQKMAVYESCLKYQIEYATTRTEDAKELNYFDESIEIYQGELP